MVNTNGIDLNSKQVKPFSATENFYLYLINAEFNFYLNQTLINEANCDENLNPASYFLSTFTILYLKQNKFKSKICPLVFRNTLIKQLFITDISNSLLVKNKLIFIDLSKAYNEINTSNFYLLTLELQYESLTSKLISKHVFKNLFQIRLHGVLDRIEADLFKSFRGLKNIDLRIYNLKELFQSGNEWMIYLNNDVSVDLNKLTSVYVNLKSYMNLRFQYNRVAFIRQCTIFGRLAKKLIYNPSPLKNLIYYLFIQLNLTLKTPKL